MFLKLFFLSLIFTDLICVQSSYCLRKHICNSWSKFLYYFIVWLFLLGISQNDSALIKHFIFIISGPVSYWDWLRCSDSLFGFTLARTRSWGRFSYNQGAGADTSRLHWSRLWLPFIILIPLLKYAACFWEEHQVKTYFLQLLRLEQTRRDGINGTEESGMWWGLRHLSWLLRGVTAERWWAQSVSFSLQMLLGWDQIILSLLTK